MITRKAYQKIKLNAEEQNQTCIIDCDASAQRSRYLVGISPCITRSRNTGHWISSRARKMNINEIMRLQGIDPTTFIKSVSPTELGRQVGNAMSINVIERILYRVLITADLLAGWKPTQDRWQSGEAIRQLTASVEPLHSQVAT